MLEAGSGNAALGLTARIRGLTVAKRKPRIHLRNDLDMTHGEAELFEELSPGGLSNHWSCAVPRFSPDDFEDAARAGEEFAWPIGYDDLVPWYERVEPLLRIAGSARGAPRLPAGKVDRVVRLDSEWQGVAQASSGRDVVPMPYAFGGQTTVTRAATPFNAYSRLLKPRERSGALRVRYDSQAVRLEYSPGQRRVTAVIWAAR
jgi:choline dehydrogenase-like flavoprotein